MTDLTFWGELALYLPLAGLAGAGLIAGYGLVQWALSRRPDPIRPTPKIPAPAPAPDPPRAENRPGSKKPAPVVIHHPPPAPKPRVAVPAMAAAIASPATPAVRSMVMAPPKANGRSRKKKELRSSLRREGDPVPVRVMGIGGSSEASKGRVIDRSRGGLCLGVLTEVPAGTVIQVRSEKYAEDAPWVEVEVRHCRQRNGEWLLGCKFVTEQPWSVLLMFG